MATAALCQEWAWPLFQLSGIAPVLYQPHYTSHVTNLPTCVKPSPYCICFGFFKHFSGLLLKKKKENPCMHKNILKGSHPHPAA